MQKDKDNENLRTLLEIVNDETQNAPDADKESESPPQILNKEPETTDSQKLLKISTTVGVDDLLRRKGALNLQERKVLLKTLGTLFTIQMIFMNLVIMLIIAFCVFKWSFFRDVDDKTLSVIVDLSKYYVTAVLVELLGGIIFIVHRVFSDKTIDNMKNKN